uniref:Nuclear speckle splicing regulatory protein 1 N-terminal domain-containing protein n=1 Tax=Romanomermis culicivorax TaxID=13658 RepID=A0A915HTU2_ROMCU
MSNPVSDNSSKKYGLLLAKHQLKTTASKLSVFDDSDDDNVREDQPSSRKVKAVDTKVKRHVQNQIKRALEQDPSVFEYDAIYDDIERKRNEKMTEKQSKDVKREPKYIKQLLKAQKIRQNEYEAREERKNVKEREKEGGEFDDKEVFVTGAYKKRMEELETYKEDEIKRKMIESVMDVTKQRDITGFYKHFLNDVTGPKTEDKPGQLKIERKENSSKHYRTRRESSESENDVIDQKRVKDEVKSEESDENEFPDVEQSTKHRKPIRTLRSPSPYTETAPIDKAELSLRIAKEENLEIVTDERIENAERIKKIEQNIVSEKEESELMIKKRLEKLRLLLGRQNDEEAIGAYKQRYLERKAFMED